MKYADFKEIFMPFFLNVSDGGDKVAENICKSAYKKASEENDFTGGSVRVNAHAIYQEIFSLESEKEDVLHLFKKVYNKDLPDTAYSMTLEEAYERILPILENVALHECAIAGWYISGPGYGFIALTIACISASIVETFGNCFDENITLLELDKITKESAISFAMFTSHLLRYDWLKPAIMKERTAKQNMDFWNFMCKIINDEFLCIDKNDPSYVVDLGNHQKDIFGRKSSGRIDNNAGLRDYFFKVNQRIIESGVLES